MVLRCRNTYVSLASLFLLILSPFPLIAGVDGIPTREHLDVAISELRWSSKLGERAWPGAQLKINISLGHDIDPIPSDTPIYPEDNLTLLIMIDDGFHNVTTMYYKIPSLPLNYSLDKNGTFNPYYFEFYWWANITYGGSSGNIEGDVSLSATLLISDNDTSDNAIGVGISVRHIKSQPFIWEEGQGDREYESPAPHMVDVGDVVSIPFELQNNGGEIDTFEFVVLSIPEGWNISLGGPYTVYPNDEIEIEMFVIVSENPFQALSDDEHHITVNVRSIYEPNMTYSQQTIHTFRFKVRFMASAELYPESDNVYLIPGEAHQVIYWLRNTGNFVDDYTLSAILDDVHLRKGWKVAFESGTRLPTVRPDHEFKVIIRVQVPEDAPLNYAVILTLTLRSMNMHYNTTSDPCTIFADIRYAARIEEFHDPFNVVPGEYNQINFNFTNEGNSKDPTLNLSITYMPKGWSVEIDQTSLTDEGGLGPKTTVLMEMSVFVNETTVASSKGNLQFIVIQARGGEDQRYLLAEERYYFRIPLIHKVELRSEMDMIVGDPGEEVQFNFTLENRGTWLDTFNVSIPGIDLVFDINPSSAELAPGELFQFKAAFIIPLDWPADSDLSTPGVTNGTLFDPYIIKLEARSQSETYPDSSLAQHPIEMFILPRYDLEMEVVDGPVWKVPYDHDQFRTFFVEVRNSGNSICELEVSLETSYSWIDTVDENIPLAFNETRYLPVYLNYRAFGMEEFEDPFIDMVISIQGTDGEMEFFHHELSFRFLPYTFYIEIVEVVDPKWMMDGSYLVYFGENQSFRVLIVRDGQSMYLPEDIDGPYVVMYIDGVERVRLEIPEMDTGNKTYLEFGPLQMLFKGKHDVEFAIVGMGSESMNRVSNWSLVLTSEAPKGHDSDKEKSSIIPVVIGILVIIDVLVMVGAGILLYIKYISKKDEDEITEENTIGFQLKMNKN